MSISDEQLSAFLDAELSADEMDAVRNQLLSDESLADRLAELAVVDEWVAAHAKTIDERPLPTAVLDLLNTPVVAPSDQKVPLSAQVIAFPLWRRLQNSMKPSLAVAASVALAFGFGLSQLLQRDAGADEWQAVAKVLEAAPSGRQAVARGGVNVTPRLSFKNHSGQYCRHFILENSTGSSENIACRQNGSWQKTASVIRDTGVTEDYQPASGGGLLEDILDEMVADSVLSASDEAAVMAKNWQP